MKSRERTDDSAILERDTKGRGDASTSPAVDAHPKEVTAVTNSSKSSPTVSPEPTQCEAVVYHRIGFGRWYRCEKKATRTVAVVCKDAPERTEAHLCGTHQRVLQRRFVDLFTGISDDWPRNANWVVARLATDPARQGEEATR